MPRKGENIYHRKDGRWEGRLAVGRTSGGKTAYRYFYGHSYAEVKRRLAEALVLRDKEPAGAGRLAVYADGTTSRWLAHWLEEENRPFIKSSTYGVYRRQIEQHILPVVGSLPLRKVDSTALERLKDALLSKGLSYRTAQGITKRFLAALRMAWEKNLIPSLPISPFDRRRDAKGPVRGRPRFLTLTEQLRLEQQLDSSRKSDQAVLLSLYTGLRVGEVSALVWRDLDLDAGTLKIGHTLQRIPTFGEENSGKRTLLQYTPPKSESSHREIPLPTFLVQLLQSVHKKEEPAADHFIFGKGCRPSEPRVLQNRLARLARQAGLEKVHFHTLRHTFATRFLERQPDLQMLKELLGHSSSKITLDWYGHSTEHHKRRTMARLRPLDRIA